MKLRQVHERVAYADQLQEDSGMVVSINVFHLAPEDVEHFVEVWALKTSF